MFSLLNPFSLWLGAALAVPLMIHFLGRQRMRRQPFPSLLLVRERFSKSMHRHRLKNLLLLILRTLLILCLLLALANPVLESRQASAKPDLSLALVHNGIYGRLGLSGNGGNGIAGGSGGADAGGSRGSEALQAQWLRLRALDSSEGISTQAFPIITDGPGPREVSERFGAYREAVGRALSALGSSPGSAQLRLPVFAWSDPASAKGELLRALADHPGLQIVLTDYTAAAAKTAAFAGLKATPSPNAPTMALQARLDPAAAEGTAKVQVYLNGRPFQEASPQGGRVEVTLPLEGGPGTVGKFSLAGFAAPDLHFCLPDAGEWLLVHAGSATASLPSLGRETYFRRIAHLASAKDIPWTGTADAGGSRAGRAAGKSAGKTAGREPRLVYLAAERGSQPEAYARAVEFVKRGGRLIIGVGRESDIPSLNRFLLQPLRLGRLGNGVESDGKVPVTADRQALARLGHLPADPGTLGAVRKRFAFAPDSGVEILLSQGGAGNAVLAARSFQRGWSLLWTTDIDDLDWTDIGVSPLTPLLHQAFQEAGSGEGSANAAVASDSVYQAVLDGSGAADRVGEPGARAVQVLDPDGRPFTKVKTDGNRLRIGPFDKLGIHRIVLGKDTSAFAVNLMSPAAGKDAAEAKAEFLKDFGAYRGRLAVSGPDEPVAIRASVRKLWPALLFTAILLLLLEGLISALFSLRRNRP